MSCLKSRDRRRISQNLKNFVKQKVRGSFETWKSFCFPSIQNLEMAPKNEKRYCTSASAGPALKCFWATRGSRYRTTRLSERFVMPWWAEKTITDPDLIPAPKPPRLFSRSSSRVRKMILILEPILQTYSSGSQKATISKLRYSTPAASVNTADYAGVTYH